MESKQVLEIKLVKHRRYDSYSLTFGASFDLTLKRRFSKLTHEDCMGRIGTAIYQMAVASGEDI